MSRWIIMLSSFSFKLTYHEFFVFCQCVLLLFYTSVKLRLQFHYLRWDPCLYAAFLQTPVLYSKYWMKLKNHMNIRLNGSHTIFLHTCTLWFSHDQMVCKLFQMKRKRECRHERRLMITIKRHYVYSLQ